MTAREARARGVRVDGNVPDVAVLEPRGWRVEGDRVVTLYRWHWEMLCYAEADGSIPEPREVVTTSAGERAVERRRDLWRWSR